MSDSTRRMSKADRAELRERIRIADAYTCTPVADVIRQREVDEAAYYSKVAHRCNEAADRA